MRRLLPILLFLLFPAAAIAQPVEVKRVLRTFDFEERRLNNPEDLPMHWAKVDGPGLPHYVNGRLATDQAHSGQYSFRFDLNGGGLVYRYDSGIIKALQGAHYRVDAYCKTTVLPNARARVTAYFVDVDNRILPETVRHSELYAATTPDEDWHRLSVELSVVNPRAGWVVIELALLQPAQFMPQSLGKRTLHTQDIRGTAWFDDLTISQVPKVAMTTARPGNVFRRGELLRLQVSVDDPFTDDLSAQLVVRDAMGQVVFQRTGALDLAGAENVGPVRKRMPLDLPDLPAGWYEASLVMSSQGQYLGSQTVDFIQLADAAPAARPDDRFGINATSLPFDGWDELPQLLPLLSAGRVKLALWSEVGDIQAMDPAAFDALLERLQELGITPTACLTDLPPELGHRLEVQIAAMSAAATGSGPNDKAVDRPADPSRSGRWRDLLRADPQEWQPQLAYLISRHANHLDRWQLGADGSDAFVTDPKMREVYKLVYAEFAKLVQKPDLAMPWPAWYELEGELPATVALSVPSSVVLPHQLPLYIQDTRGQEGHNLSLSLEWLDRARYGREAQIRDTAQRLIYALSAGARRIDVPLPFSVRRDGEGEGSLGKQPQELLLILRTLISTLSGATYRGKVPIAEGVEAFLFERNGKGVMALWDRGASGGGGERELALNLGDHPASIDLWGNVRPLLKRAGAGKDGRPGEVRLLLGTMPLLLVDIDGQLAQLRSSVAIDRPLIESSFQPHVRHVQFANAYKTQISGLLRLKPPLGWKVNPPTINFSLNPGETFDRELTLEIPYNSIAGTKTINADFSLQGERTTDFSVPIQISLGLSDVGMQSIALRDGADVVVQQMITNYGDTPINYGAFAVYPGQARQERLVTQLGPGRTTIKRYRFANAPPTETTVRVGVKELVGTRILNDEVRIQ